MVTVMDLASQTLLPLLAALLCGSLIGLERSYRGRAAGMRTYALVCLTSCMLMALSGYAQRNGAALQLAPVVQGIMTGVGFLGAGVIFREGFSVRGLTTAASVWATAALGVLIGLQRWEPALAAWLAIMGVLAGLRLVEMHMRQETYAQLMVRYARGRQPPEATVRAQVEDHGFQVAEVSYRVGAHGGEYEYRMTVFTRQRANLARLAATLAIETEVHAFRLEAKVE